MPSNSYDWRITEVGLVDRMSIRFMATAYAKSDDLDHAKESLVKSVRSVDEWTESMLQAEVGATRLPWFDDIEGLLL